MQFFAYFIHNLVSNNFNIMKSVETERMQNNIYSHINQSSTILHILIQAFEEQTLNSIFTLTTNINIK